ncbi:MAG: aldo/keto reductase [Propionibacteriaceae bacterium]|nr:aldo/keto reductase [Propionibacteriaceae bacterium]
MKRRRVGEIEVSRLGLGTLTWGRDTSPKDARGLLRAFVSAGGNLVDTAAAYGRGDAERIIGKILERDVDRDDIVIATKAGFKVSGMEKVVDTSPRALLDDLRGSLKRLGTDHIDIWQLHAWDDEHSLETTLEAMDQAVQAGYAREIGVSNFVGWQLSQAATRQRDLGKAPVASAQAEYSLLARGAEYEIIPACQHLGVAFLPWSPIGRGVLTGKYQVAAPTGSRGNSSNFSWFVEPYLEPGPSQIVKAVQVAADGLELTPAQVALLWVRDAPGVTAPLLGPRNAAQLKPYLQVEDLELPAEIVSALDDVSGGPK